MYLSFSMSNKIEPSKLHPSLTLSNVVTGLGYAYGLSFGWPLGKLELFPDRLIVHGLFIKKVIPFHSITKIQYRETYKVGQLFPTGKYKGTYFRFHHNLGGFIRYVVVSCSKERSDAILRFFKENTQLSQLLDDRGSKPIEIQKKVIRGYFIIFIVASIFTIFWILYSFWSGFSTK